MVSCVCGSTNKSSLAENRYITIKKAPFGKMKKNAEQIFTCLLASKMTKNLVNVTKANSLLS